MKASYQKLIVWQKAVDLVVEIYKVTTGFPSEEKFGLMAQMRRSAVSIPSNIAEGSQRRTDKAFAQFIAVSKGSCAELETQTIISCRLNYIEEIKKKELIEKINELMRMLSSLYKKLQTTD
ncbi:MAG TPA: four helix bundle protein [Candidatus Peregrinibacteria bacterium]|nr:four helix bundle protein [Candidatus Peregrinibacteria bacterium]